MNSVSIVVPIYYGENYIPDIITQIEECRKLLGTDDYIEIIFVNDAPEMPISQEWDSELVKIIILNSDRNSGIHGARVRGLMYCSGEYVLFLDQDDKIEPAYFKSQLQMIGESDAVICKALNGGKEFYQDDRIFHNMIKKEFVLKEWNWIISPGQVLLRRQSIPDTWIQNVMRHNGADDWLLWICMIAEEKRFSLNNKILYDHVLSKSNFSNNIVTMLRSEQEVMKIIKEKEILSGKEFQLLTEGFCDRNIRKIEELYYAENNAKMKLHIVDKWIELGRRNIKYSDYLQQNFLKKVAIYGCGTIGECLYDELKKVIDIRYFIDRNARSLSKEIPVYTLQDALPEVDGIIISLIGGIEKVETEMRKKGHKNIFIFKDWIIENAQL